MSRPRNVAKVHVCAPGKFVRSFTAAEFNALPLVGYQDFGDGDRQVLRNCPCGSTLAMPMTDDHANDTKGATT